MEKIRGNTDVYVLCKFKHKKYVSMYFLHLVLTLTPPLHQWFIIHVGPHRGIPNLLAERNNGAARIAAGQNVIPTVDDAAASYAAAGGHLSPMAQFGSDPLAESPELIQQRQSTLEENIPTPEDLFAFTVNGDYAPFAQSLQFLQRLL